MSSVVQKKQITMEKFELDKLRKLPIEGVAERLGLRVRRHKALCPFHADSHPSLSFHVGRNTYKCFVCDAHGGPIDLAMKLTGKPFIEACRWLADEHNVILTEWKPAEKPRRESPPDVEYLSGLVAHPLLNADASEFLYRERKIHPAVVRWMGISSISLPTPCRRHGRPYYDAPSLLFPYRDRMGRLMNVQSRYLGRMAGIPRFRFPSGSECRIFGLPVLERLQMGEGLWLSEGVTDCLALLSSGRKAIAIPGATLLKPEDVKLLADLRTEKRTVFHIFPDQDPAGERLYRRLLQAMNDIGACLIRDSLPEGFKDFGQWWATQN